MKIAILTPRCDGGHQDTKAVYSLFDGSAKRHSHPIGVVRWRTSVKYNKDIVSGFEELQAHYAVGTTDDYDRSR